MTYTKYKRGSEWRKWDLHIHTPETKKNDQFTGATPEDKWNNYINSINSSPEIISVIGITDYFSIDNYFKFKHAALDGKFTRPFDLILPNIELRIHPVTSSSTPINIHCIFNPEIDSEIQDRFLSNLSVQYNGSKYSATKSEFIRLGKALPGNSSIGDAEAFNAGMQQFVISITTLREIFESDPKLRENTIIVVSNKSNDGASGLRHAELFVGTTSQLDVTRWSIYQLSDAIFSSNAGDILYFTGNGVDSKETVIEKCATLMPCFHGCDAHENSKIFNPDLNRFCWIKADPTFEGLRQTLYEPVDRVKIQTLKPEEKNDRHVISEIKFIDSTEEFGNQSILLNDNLNAIIGGKSSGKSLLLYSIANSIDPEQVQRTSKRLNFSGYDFKFDFEVTWKSGEKDQLKGNLADKKHKITYIPQLYINHLVEKNNKEELNSLIKSILLQDATFKEFYDGSSEIIKKITHDIDVEITRYLEIRSSANAAIKDLQEIGKPDDIQKGIDGLQENFTKGQKASNFTAEDIASYDKLNLSKLKLEEEIGIISKQEEAFALIVQELIKSEYTMFGDGQIHGAKDLAFEFVDKTDEINNVLLLLQTDFTKLIEDTKQRIAALKLDEKKVGKYKELGAVVEQLKPFQARLAGQGELKKLSAQIEAEKVKLQKSKDLTVKIAAYRKSFDETRLKIAAKLQERFNSYKAILNYVNTEKSTINREVTLNSKLQYRINQFDLYDQTNKAATKSDNILYTGLCNIEDQTIKYEAVIDLFQKPIKVADNKLHITDTGSIPLKQSVELEDVLRGLAKDRFELDYTVTYRGDELLSMSPGKKGTVLLILFLQISSAEYPILIDQPEDNLDNRTIYELLCQMIKDKKKERQIIIVSHNANLVVSTDAENIIVANQDGQEKAKTPGMLRFTYVNGALEFTFSKNAAIQNILLQQGIREHVCDILEGGNEAFKQRERKYSIK